jgi:predicted Zn-dependent protease
MKTHRTLSLLAVLIAVLTACSTVPVSERTQLTLIPRDDLLATSFQQYDRFLEENELSDNEEQARLVREVGTDIADAVGDYVRERGRQSELAGYAWEFNLVENDAVNAWCMPGGKVVVYEGIMPVAQDAGGLAVIMGHEIAHAVADHGNERMSQQLVFQLGGAALQTALEDRPAQTRSLWLAAYGAGAQVGVLLPYSRLHESEADRLGLIFMAMAGYDPREAVSFWQRMSELKGGAGPPEFLSTHPADQTRIENLREFMPTALEYYEPHRGK